MSGRAWTSGPWSVQRSSEMYDGEYDYAINADCAQVLAEARGADANGGYLPAHANARLIAAAPGLFEALAGLLDAYKGLAAIGEERARRMNEAERAARAALSKAEGGSA